MIRFAFLLTLFLTFSQADEYPKLFEQLGTPLYKADHIFAQFSYLEKVKAQSRSYHKEAIKLLIFARHLEENPHMTEKDKQTYFKRLRDLQNEHDDIMRIIHGELLHTIDANDYKKFTDIINIGQHALFQNNIILKRAMAYYVTYRTRGRIPVLDEYYLTLDSDPILMDYVKGHMPMIRHITQFYTAENESRKVLLSSNEKFAYVADGKYCFKLLDIKNFTDSSELSAFDFNGKACDLVDITFSSSNQYLYLSDIQNGFTVINHTQPEELLQKGEYLKQGISHVIPSSDDKTAFIIRQQRGISFLDISDKEDFRLLAHYNKKPQVNHIALDENRSRLYLAHDKGLSVLDISTIANPREVFTLPLKNGANHLVLSADHTILFAASGEEGVNVIDLSHDENISLASNCLTPKYAHHLALSKDGKKLFVSALEDGIYQLDTTDVHDIRHVLTYKTQKTDTTALNSALNQKEGTLYIAFGKDGIAKVKLKD